MSAQKPSAVYFDGPQSDCDDEGEECPCWTVFAGDDDAEPVGKISFFRDFMQAAEYAHSLASRLHVALCNEAQAD